MIDICGSRRPTVWTLRVAGPIWLSLPKRKFNNGIIKTKPKKSQQQLHYCRGAVTGRVGTDRAGRLARRWVSAALTAGGRQNGSGAAGVKMEKVDHIIATTTK